jgi:hypothetical protein
MNIAEILKKCPKGTKLYSLVHGEVTLENIISIGKYPIEVVSDDGGLKYYTKDGLVFANFPNGECVLVPSKNQRDWSKFGVSDKETKPQFKPFDKVLVRDRDDRKWGCDFFCHLGDKEGVFVCISSWWRQCIPYEGNEHLLGTTKKPEE